MRIIEEDSCQNANFVFLLSVSSSIKRFSVDIIERVQRVSGLARLANEA